MPINVVSVWDSPGGPAIKWDEPTALVQRYDTVWSANCPTSSSPDRKPFVTQRSYPPGTTLLHHEV